MQQSKFWKRIEKYLAVNFDYMLKQTPSYKRKIAENEKCWNKRKREEFELIQLSIDSMINQLKKAEIEKNKAETERDKANISRLKLSIKTKRKLDKIDKASRARTAILLTRPLEKLSKDERFVLGINQALADGYQTLREQNASLLEETLNLKAETLSNTATLLAQTSCKFKRIPLALYSKKGEFLYESARFGKYCSKIPANILSSTIEDKNFQERLNKKGETVKSYGKFEAHFTPYKTKDKLAAVSVYLMPAKTKIKERTYTIFNRHRKEATGLLQKIWKKHQATFQPA